MPGKGRMTVTGNLRDVMKESISAAASYVRSRAVAFGIEPPLFDKRDIHVHVPEGATPKDGPSAGVAMVTAIVSVMTGIPVRRDVAMTGEITLRGRVLPIGGLKEKLLGRRARRHEDRADPGGERQGSHRRSPTAIKKGLEIIPVTPHGRGAGARAGAQARADRMGRERRPSAADVRPISRPRTTGRASPRTDRARNVEVAKRRGRQAPPLTFVVARVTVLASRLYHRCEFHLRNLARGAARFAATEQRTGHDQERTDRCSGRQDADDQDGRGVRGRCDVRRDHDDAQDAAAT